jgi:hypothetical protein
MPWPRNRGWFFAPPGRLGTVHCSAEKPSNAIQWNQKEALASNFLWNISACLAPVVPMAGARGERSSNGSALPSSARSPLTNGSLKDKAFRLSQASSLVSSRYACGVYNIDVIRRHISLLSQILSIPQTYLLQLFPSIYSCFIDPLSKTLKMNFTTSGINGTIKEWDGAKGTLQSDTAISKDKKFWFDKSNLYVPRYSAAYEPKVGDYVTSTAIADDETRVGHVMQSIRMWTSTTCSTIHDSLYFRIKLDSRHSLGY